jgi:predicted dehydrogenase
MVNPSSPLKGVVIGFGRMGITHFAILNSRPDLQICAICDPSAFLRSNVQRYLGTHTDADYRSAIDDLRPDFAIVATPSHLHAESVRYALEHGLHVFVEKPFCVSTIEGRELVDLARRQACVNQVGYVLRFNDVIREVKKLLDPGVISTAIRYRIDMNSPTVLRGAKGTWRFKRGGGGGCLSDLASHAIDLACYLFGSPEHVLSAVLQRIHSQEVEDAVLATFSHKTGACGTVGVNWSDPSVRKPTLRIEAVGRDWKITADLHEYRVYFHNHCPVNGFKRGWNTRFITDCFRPVQMYVRGYEFSAQLHHFIDCIKSGSSSQCSFQDGLQTDVLIRSIRQAAIT